MIILISISILVATPLYLLLISASSLDELAERKFNKKYKPVERKFMVGDYMCNVKYK